MANNMSFTQVTTSALTIAAGLITAAILWVGSTVQGNQVKLATIEVSLTELKESISKRGEKLAELENRISKIEGRLNHDNS